MAMEGFWLAVALLVLDAMMAAPSRPFMAAAVILYPLAYLAAGLVQRFDRSVKTELLVAAGLFLTGSAVIAVTTAAFEASRLWVIGIIGGFAWLRGWTLAGKDADLSRFVVAFQVGLMVLLAILALGELLSVDRPVLMGVGAAFFLCGLAGIRQARIAEYAGRESGAARARSGGLAALGFLFVAAAAVALWVAVDRSALELLLAVVSWLGDRFQQLIVYLSGLMPEFSFPENEPIDDPSGAASPEQPHRQEKPPEEFSPLNAYILIGIASVLLIAFVGFILWQAIRFLIGWFRRTERTPGVVYRRSSVGLRDGLLAFWRGLIAGLVGMGQGMARLVRRLAWRRLADSSVRDIYRRLLLRLALDGWWRAPHETPDEYLGRVKVTWKGDVSDLEKLTAAFVAERYGMIDSDPGEARAAWLRLRKTLRQMRSAHG